MLGEELVDVVEPPDALQVGVGDGGYLHDIEIFGVASGYGVGCAAVDELPVAVLVVHQDELVVDTLGGTVAEHQVDLHVDIAVVEGEEPVAEVAGGGEEGARPLGGVAVGGEGAGEVVVVAVHDEVDALHTALLDDANHAFGYLPVAPGEAVDACHAESGSDILADGFGLLLALGEVEVVEVAGLAVGLPEGFGNVELHTAACRGFVFAGAAVGERVAFGVLPADAEVGTLGVVLPFAGVGEGDRTAIEVEVVDDHVVAGVGNGAVAGDGA